MLDKAMPDHEVAIRMVLDALVDEKYGVIQDLKEIDAAGHRLVHGGEKFSSSVIIDDEVIKAVEECNPLAPLHLRLPYSIQHSIRQWSRSLICMDFRMSIMKNIKYAAMVFMGRVTALYQAGRLNY